ncbi:MAG: cytidine deaminase [Acidobacteriaceae bacterium]
MDLARLQQLAHDALPNAYAPYSHFQVGAALLLTDGRTFTGVNVENASYGLTNCAERSAIFAAASATPSGRITIAAIAIDNSAATACSPCGACRQVIAEFSAPETVITYRGPNGWTKSTLAQLLPDSFRL